MKEFLKRYRIKLEIVTPVFIGSGQEINKKEYIYDPKTKKAWIPNQSKLFKSIMTKHLMEKYEQYMLEKKLPLLDWMRSVGYKDKEIQNLCDYYFDCSYALENMNSPIAISQFMKDAYGLPYIPGSSLKGAIRTVLLGSRMLHHPEEYNSLRKDVLKSPTRIDGKNNQKYLQAEGKKAEEIGFHVLKHTDKVSDAKNDELKGLLISDSKSLKVSDLMLCQKVDFRLDKKKNALNTLRECLKPGTVVEFDMTIDTTVLDLSAEEIMQALNDFFQLYQDVYVKKFTKVSPTSRGNLYLGGGTGYGTKTVTYELLEEDDRMQIVENLMKIKFPKHYHSGDAQRGASPHTLKCTKYNGKLVVMGKCVVHIEEISS